jgi:hypothetical protein
MDPTRGVFVGGRPLFWVKVVIAHCRVRLSASFMSAFLLLNLWRHRNDAVAQASD